MTILLAVAIGLQGCVGFSGPNGIRNSIARSQDVKLEKEFGVDVGPLGFFVVNTLALPFVPMTMDGMEWAAFGEYTIKPTAKCSLSEFNLDAVELKGWEPFVRVREPGSSIKIMYNAGGDHIRKMLFLAREGNQLMIVKAEGNFDKIIDNLFKSDLLKDMDLFNEFEDPGEYVPDEETIIEVARGPG